MTEFRYILEAAALKILLTIFWLMPAQTASDTAGMIGRFIGVVGHAIWWYSEDKHREVDEEEEMGMDPKEIFELLEKSGFEKPEIKKFVYRLNYLYISKPKK